MSLIKSNITGDLTDTELAAVLDRLAARRIIPLSDNGAATYPA